MFADAADAAMPRGVPAGGWAAGGPAFMQAGDAERYEKLFEQHCHETGFVSGKRRKHKEKPREAERSLGEA